MCGRGRSSAPAPAPLPPGCTWHGQLRPVAPPPHPTPFRSALRCAMHMHTRVMRRSWGPFTCTTSAAWILLWYLPGVVQQGSKVSPYMGASRWAPCGGQWSRVSGSSGSIEPKGEPGRTPTYTAAVNKGAAAIKPQGKVQKLCTVVQVQVLKSIQVLECIAASQRHKRRRAHTLDGTSEY